MALGNLMCQAIMYPKEKKFDPYKTLQYTAFGLLCSVR
jgi:hypothetical protein